MTKILSSVKIFIFTAQNELSIIKHPEALFSVDFQKHEKAKTNILRYTKDVGKIKVTNDLKRKIEQNLKFFAFRLTELYEHEFPLGRTKFK